MNYNIAITDSYLDSVFKLNSPLRKLTTNTIKQLSNNPRSNSLQIHKIDRLKCDDSFRSARVNDNLRIIFSCIGDTYTLLYVDNHDDAYKWCDGKYIRKTDFGAQYIFDEKVMVTYENKKYPQDPFQTTNKTSTLENANIREKHLIKLGIPQIHASNLLNISDEDDFIEYITIFPDEISEALLDLATQNRSYDEIVLDLNDEIYNSSNNNNIQHKDTKRRFYIPDSLDELDLLMEHDSYEKWRLFLHPSQESIVRANFKGPVLIEGGPGTGKTIVGIHRSIYLSKNVFTFENNKRILFCTFSKKLSSLITEKVQALSRQKGVTNNIEVTSVDSLINKILYNTYGKQLYIDINKFNYIFDSVYEKLVPNESKTFYKYEYSKVIEKFNIKSLSEYLNIDRSGAGVPLDKNKRIKVWEFFEEFLKLKMYTQTETFVDRAFNLLDGLEKGEIKPMYDSIIIDEAQDLESAKLRAICKCVRTSENNIFILSDANQRIFSLNTWKRDIDINIVGRTHHLSINYRTTKQINDYARYQFFNSEMEKSHIKEYKSIVNGVDPEVVGFRTESENHSYIIEKLNYLMGKGIKPYQICIVTPNSTYSKIIKSVLAVAGINTTILSNDIAPNENSEVCICTVLGVKGLEFEVVIMYQSDKIGQENSDYREYQGIKIDIDKLIECSKYVAVTRARDELIVTYLEEGPED